MVNTIKHTIHINVVMARIGDSRLAPREKPSRSQVLHGRVDETDVELSGPCGYWPSRQSSSTCKGNLRRLPPQSEQERSLEPLRGQYGSQSCLLAWLVACSSQRTTLSWYRVLTRMSKEWPVSGRGQQHVIFTGAMRSCPPPPPPLAGANLRIVAALSPQRGSHRRHLTDACRESNCPPCC